MTPMTLSDPEIVWPAKAILGEGPVWDGVAHVLYWVDIKGLKLHRYSPANGAKESWVADEPIGCIDVPNDDGELLAATRSGFAWLALNSDRTVTRKPIVSPEADTLPGNRFNDGKRAPDGTFWAGTMDDAEEADSGAWWCLDTASGNAIKKDEGYRVTNGPAFDPANNRIYVTDSARQSVFVASFDPKMGANLSSKTVFLQFGDGDGYPDGMQAFPDGSLWIAFWDGGCLRRFSPGGELIQEIALPMQRPTSLAFAPEISSVFVTSAAIGLADDGTQGGLAQLRWS